MPHSAEHTLASFLKERRARLSPAALGLPLGRRRTPGLRREEVAQRAHVSATWYTWLEQGRGGAPSADVLDRLSRALELTADEREHLFLLAQDRPPPVHAPAAAEVTPQVQRVLDERPGHSAPETRFLTELEDYLSENEAQRVLETVINWGRYAELFAYDYDSGILSLENP